MTDIPYSWLHQKGTPEKFELDRLEQAAAAFNLPFDKVAQKFAGRPFGILTDVWRTFVAQMEAGDELWSFSSPDETFSEKQGCQGFAIVRGGTIQDTLITLRT
jgi:hypothetical protein